jgi:hypothetical protein
MYLAFISEHEFAAYYLFSYKVPDMVAACWLAFLAAVASCYNLQFDPHLITNEAKEVSQ